MPYPLCLCPSLHVVPTYSNYENCSHSYLLVKSTDTQQRQTIVQNGHNKSTDDRPIGSSHAPHQAGTADYRGSNGVHFIALRRSWVRRVQPADKDHASETRKQSGQHVDDPYVLRCIDPRQPRCFFVASDGVRVPT